MASCFSGLAVSAGAFTGLAIGAAVGVQQLRRQEEEFEDEMQARATMQAAIAAAVANVQPAPQALQDPYAGTRSVVSPTLDRGGDIGTMSRKPKRIDTVTRFDIDEEDEGEPFSGFTMEEARSHAEFAANRAMNRKPNEVLADMQRGNTRFWMGQASRPEKNAFQRRALISKQFPSVAILGCSDSRVPTEIVFDQGLGDIFVIRVAGNCLEPSSLASVQYAVHHLKVKLVIVLGHEMCGAVKAAQLPSHKVMEEPAELQHVLESIRMGLDEEALSHVQDARALDREAVTSNVKRQVERLTHDGGIMSKVKDNELIMVGAFYEISSGIVDFFFEVSSTSDDGVTDPDAVPRQPSFGVQSRFSPEDGEEMRRIPSGGLERLSPRRQRSTGLESPKNSMSVVDGPAHDGKCFPASANGANGNGVVIRTAQ